MIRSSPVFCALDTGNLNGALAMATAVAPHVGGLKLGLEFFIANGPDGVQKIRTLGLPVFLDLKLHDIPNTVAGAVRSAILLGVDFLTVHISGGREMLRQAVEAAEGKIKLLGVTVLTSLDDGDMAETGRTGHVAGQVDLLAALAQDCGLDGLVCSPLEIALVRQRVTPETILMVPGIRPGDVTTQDQKRTLSPRAAMEAGATYLVVGRPITAAPDPVEAAAAIGQSLANV